MSDVSTGYLATFGIGNGAGPEVFTALAEVASMTPPSINRDDIETTHLTSPNGYKEYKPTMKDPGIVKLVLNWIPGTGDDTALRALFNDSDLHNFQIAYPNGAVEDLTGYAKSFVPGELSPDGKMTAECEIKLSGGTVLTP